MKQKTITTDKATLLVVELPEGAKFIRIETNQAVVPYGQEVNYEVPATKESYGYEETEGFALPEGNWQLLGRLPDITEEQADKVVEEYTYNTGGIDGYYDYENDTQTDCPIESLNSLMYTNEIYFENPLGIDRPILALDDKDYDEFGFVVGEGIEKGKVWEDKYWDWLETGKKVWDKERTFLLIKVD